MNQYRRIFPFSMLSLMIAVALTACYAAQLGAIRQRLPLHTAILGPMVVFPMFLIWSNAVVVLFNRRNRHPFVSMFATIGLAGIAISWLSTVVVLPWLAKESGAWRGMYFSLLSLGQLIVNAISLWCLAVAVLGWRGSDNADSDNSGSAG